MALKFHYTGDGSYLPGIPPRDLTDQDELTDEQWADVATNAAHEQGSIYEQVTIVAEPVKPPARASEESSELPDGPAATRKGG